MSTSEVVIWKCRVCGSEDRQNKSHCYFCSTPNTYDSTIIEAKDIEKALRQRSRSMRVTEVEFKKVIRNTTNYKSIDLVLGGGQVVGSVIVMGGDPGVGKSTLLRKILAKSNRESLYITGEESEEQSMQQLDRIGAIQSSLHLCCTNSLEEIIEEIKIVDPTDIVIDSLHKISSEKINGRMGGISQCVYCTQKLYDYIKGSHRTLYIVMHVNKEGNLASSNDIKHCIDVDIMLKRGQFETVDEKEKFVPYEKGDIVQVGSSKNRFGSITNVGYMIMSDYGLTDRV